jgi:hypothetical protein
LPRSLAGILGPLAFVVVTVRAIRYSTPLGESVLTALIAMFVFAAVGMIVGKIAESAIEEAVRGRVVEELAQTDQENSPTLAIK